MKYLAIFTFLIFSISSAAELSCVDIVDSSDISGTHWKEYRKQSPVLEDVIEDIPALGHFTTMVNLFRVAKSGFLKSATQVDKESLLRSFRNKGGDASSSIYLSVIAPGAASFYSASILGPSLLFTPTILRRQDYFMNPRASHGTFDPQKSDRQKFSEGPHEWKEGYYPTEIMFENEISLEDHAVAVVIPPWDRKIFEKTTRILGVDWEAMGIEVFYGVHLPDEFVIRELVKSKKKNFNEASERYDVHKVIRASLDLHLPTLEQKIKFVSIPENRDSELGVAVLKYLIQDYNYFYPYRSGDLSAVLDHLELQLKIDVINWHWFSHALLLYSRPEDQTQIYSLMSKYGFSKPSLLNRFRQKRPTSLEVVYSNEKGVVQEVATTYKNRFQFDN